jgi:phosphatidylglycerol---prolipoprotein diacylglyceryl transferase
MYAAALVLSAATVAGTTGLPYFHLGALDVGIPIQSFGVIVAAGVLIGAALLRRYAEWHGVSDDHIRGLLAWVTITGFIGAHQFDMIAYNWDKIGDTTIQTPPSWWFLGEKLWIQNWPLPLKLWEGISSFGGFIGGAMGFAFYVWWKRLDWRLMADVTIVGLLVAFSSGRIGCTVVSDHVGSAVDPSNWYAALAMDYPRVKNIAHLAEHYPGTSEYIRAWNLGLLEFLYLVPVNVAILWLAFRSSKRPNAGFLTVMTGVLYAPVRFFLDFLRLPEGDPRYFGLTFAQWAAIFAFGAAIALALRVFKNGKPAETVGATSGEVQRRLKLILKEVEDESKAAPKAAAKAAAKSATSEAEAEAETESEAESESESEPEFDDVRNEQADEPLPRATATKPAAKKPGGGGKSGKKKKRKR